MFRVRQDFHHPPPLDVNRILAAEFVPIRRQVAPGARIAVAVGSRGITHLAGIVAAVIEQLRAAGAHPFIIPAMGSHGGATPEGQTDVLATYGVTEAAMNVPIHPSLEVRQIGTSADGAPVFCSVEALGADGVVIVNRVKPHTDFSGTIGSGLLKMCVVGLGKRTGAAAMHAAASRIGHEQAIRGIARVLLRDAPILCGVAILENQFHETARLVVVPRADFEASEERLLREARALMPLLPFDEIDLLVVDRIGKNISGAGMDPNIIGRSVDGYNSSLLRGSRPAPFIRRIFVRGLTPETHGNGIGIGNADVTTDRLVREFDYRTTYINALTSLTPQSAKLPIHFEADREALECMLTSLALNDVRDARIVRIADTLSTVEFEVSEALAAEVKKRPHLTALGKPAEWTFDAEGNLPPA